MALMNSMCIIKAEDAAIVDCRQMRHEKGKIVLDDFALSIDPNLFAQNAGAACTGKTSFIIRILA